MRRILGLAIRLLPAQKCNYVVALQRPNKLSPKIKPKSLSWTLGAQTNSLKGKRRGISFLGAPAFWQVWGGVGTLPGSLVMTKTACDQTSVVLSTPKCGTVHGERYGGKLLFVDARLSAATGNWTRRGTKI